MHNVVFSKYGIVLSLCCVLNVCILSAQNWTYSRSTNQVFSSPKCMDLNSDNIKDVVIGIGTETDSSTWAVLAIDGANGSLLWEHSTTGQMFGKAIFYDANDDGNTDVIINGRNAELRALNGSTGGLLWDFFPQRNIVAPADSGWFNFYTVKKIADVTGDNVPEIIAVNGGDASLSASDTVRQAGNIVVINGSNGAIISQLSTVDGRESYCSPVGFSSLPGISDSLQIFYGSGGETIRGGFWKITLYDLLNENQTAQQMMAVDTSKGYVSPAGLADFNSDEYLDIVAISSDGKITCFDGITNNIIWEHDFVGYENFSGVCIGKFNNDNVPDVCVNLNNGILPFYNGYEQRLLNGINGNIIETDNAGLFFTSIVACDINEDNIDEAIWIDNEIDASHRASKHRIVSRDYINNITTDLVSLKSGGITFATPWIGDLDDDGLLDIVYVYDTDTVSFFEYNDIVIERIELPAYTLTSFPAWGGYMGTNTDGIYVTSDTSSNTSINNITNPEIYIQYGNTALQIRSNILLNGVFQVLDISGKQHIKGSFAGKELELTTETMAKGIYWFVFEGKETSVVEKFIIN